jgi:hypothetical protein
MPEELAKAGGVEFVSRPRGSLVSNWLGLGARKHGSSNIFASSGDFAEFLKVLKARCEIWEMDSKRDWRRREASMTVSTENVEEPREEMVQCLIGLDKEVTRNVGLDSKKDVQDDGVIATATNGQPKMEERLEHIDAIAPTKYLISSIDTENTWKVAVTAALPPNTPSPIPWESTNLLIYGRISLSSTSTCRGCSVEFYGLMWSCFRPC